MEEYKENQLKIKNEKQKALFKSEQKRGDMKTAFYHMAVWNVGEAQDLIEEILEDDDHKVSVAEKVR